MYDYIIVGGGTAGCVLANRLTADPRISVLLLEAGGEPDKMAINIPIMWPDLWETKVDWNFKTTKQIGLNGRTVPQPRGKVLGGSSAINAMMAVRGHTTDYDEWAVLGNNGWSYADVLPYFKRSETSHRTNDPFHGISGPVNISANPNPNKLSKLFVEAAMSSGLPYNPDFNGATQEGVGFYDRFIDGGRRVNTANSYLAQARKRPNLTIRTDVLVMNLIFKDKKIAGVRYFADDEVRDAKAFREIILCAGALNTPQLLLLSGIGPAKYLDYMGIYPRIDLPGVGQNLQDHTLVKLAYKSRGGVSMVRSKRLGYLLRYFLTGRRGPASSNLVESGGFVCSRANVRRPDLQYFFLPALGEEYGANRDEGFMLAVGLLRPESHGTVTLQTTDAADAPKINPQYLSADDDLDTLARGIHLAQNIVEQPALRPYWDHPISPNRHGLSDSEMDAFIRKSLDTIYHPCGTCKMGPDSDPEAVVDERLRLRGTTGVRIVDASIMPFIPAGNTQAPVLMIAEKAADMILEDATATQN